MMIWSWIINDALSDIGISELGEDTMINMINAWSLLYYGAEHYYLLCSSGANGGWHLSCM